MSACSGWNNSFLENPCIHTYQLHQFPVCRSGWNHIEASVSAAAIAKRLISIECRTAVGVMWFLVAVGKPCPCINLTQRKTLHYSFVEVRVDFNLLCSLILCRGGPVTRQTTYFGWLYVKLANLLFFLFTFFLLAFILAVIFNFAPLLVWKTSTWNQPTSNSAPIFI